MQHPQNESKKGSGLLFSAFLGIVMLLLSAARIIGDLQSSAGEVAILDSAIEQPIWRTRLGLNVLLFLLALVALHLLFAFVCWGLSLLSERAFGGNRITRRQWISVWFIVLGAGVLIANATYFPHTSLGEPYQHFVRARLWGGTSWLTIYTVAVVAFLTCILATVVRHATGRTRLAFLACVATTLVVSAIPQWEKHATNPPHSSLPNIILLGVDSLRPDMLIAEVAPFSHEFMRGAVRFEDTITPLARTFPSWVSILTGKYPQTTGAYLNLMPRNTIHTGQTLPQLLRQHGYRSIYAIDETRFSNLDVSYGFDQAVTPRIGGSDFVLALIADTPLSNLVMNTRVGEILFPHIHANRGAHFTYDPDSFVDRLDRSIDYSGPTLLAAHLTLPHYPYTWATSAAPTGNDVLARGDYREAVRRADRQLGDILSLLSRKGFLENALVVLLSDHGEAIGQDDDLIAQDFPGRSEVAGSFQRWGHGSSVFSPTQYRVVLGIRAYGRSVTDLFASRSLHTPASLVDVTPTLLDLIRRPTAERFDGISLAPVLRDSSLEGAYTGRLRFTETEYNPEGFTSELATASALAAAVAVYRLDPVTDRLEIRHERLTSLRNERQYAALLGSRAMAAADPSGAPGQFRFVYIPLSGTGSQEEARLLYDALRNHFGIDLPEMTGKK